MGNLQVQGLAGAAQAGTPGALRIIDIAGTVAGLGPRLSGTVDPNTSAVMPGTTVTMTVAVVGSYTSVTWVLDPDSPVVEFTGTDLQKQFVAPFLRPGDPTDVTVNVTAVNANGSSVLRLFKTVVPHGLWFLRAGIWQPVTGEQRT